MRFSFIAVLAALTAYASANPPPCINRYEDCKHNLGCCSGLVCTTIYSNDNVSSLLFMQVQRRDSPQLCVGMLLA